MANPILIIGPPAAGKSYSTKNLPPDQSAICLCEKSRLPYRNQFNTFRVRNITNEKGQIVRQAQVLYSVLKKATRKIYVIDDSQYLMVNEFFDRLLEPGFQKYAEIGAHFRDLIHLVNDEMPEDVNVYFLHHIDDSSTGLIRAKTIGRVLDDKLTLEGCFDIVLRAAVLDGRHVSLTQSDGTDTTKSPEGMFSELVIPNDLAVVDAAIRDYYGLPPLPVGKGKEGSK